MLKRILSVALVIILAFSLCVASYAEVEPEGEVLTVLFTHDLHSHLLPAANEVGGGEYGGYARLMTAINSYRAVDPDALLVDGGDFSMGSLFQTAYPTSAIELRMMGAMGYDVTTFGNHEYDYLQAGLKSMLNAAVDSGDRLPELVCANYLPPREGEEGYDAEMWAAFEKYGVKKYTIIEKNGTYYAIFGIFGVDADDCAPNSGMVFEDPVSVAQETLDAAVSECETKYGKHPVVICLSHSGTEDNGKGEDYDLAKKVDGIDVIVSGHTHTTLEKPILVNDTYIVSSAEYGKNLGVIQFRFDGEGISLYDYELVPINENMESDETIAALVESYKGDVERDYLSKYGYTFDQVLVNNKYVFDTVDEVYDTQHESTLCNIFSDAYKRAVENVTGKKVDVAITAAGVIRGSLPQGDVTVSDVFNAASLGVGTEGELIGIYLTGKDLKNAIELDASVQPLMTSAQLFMSGVEYSFNTSRMIFNKVDYAMLREDDKDILTEINDEKLYFVVAGMYMGQMLGSAEETSMGILTITPRDEAGNPIAVEDLGNYVVKDENGNPLKEWYAIADYLDSMGGEIYAKYANPDGRKVVYSSLNPVKLLRNANIFTYIAILLILLVIAGIVFLTRAIIRKKKRKNA
ncbi:MAG: bifunctional metallophosphatase/5'-nucleotidase [Clostridia bacterium]|nr:bifunctional metallophosphatase/5'-nucleotidase [Clostridia bacterium]MBR2389123.1 bifunctional metallophosphatase/5'-nucleotidase [Clostridia bacterium]